MSTRLIGTDDANPRLPAVVIAATQGTTAADLAAGNTLAQAKAYTDIKVAAGGGGGGGGTAEVVVTTRAALNSLADGEGLTAGDLFLISDETPERLVVATDVDEYVNFVPVSTYRPAAPIGEVRTIAEENALPGHLPGDWQIAGGGDYGGVGYTTTMSVRAGASIDFKIHSGGAAYSLDIVRLGWYGGAGARLYDTLTNAGKVQINGNLRSTGEGGVGTRDCANWTVTDTWQVPVDATNGVYLGVITRAGGGKSHVGPFVVDNELGDQADILCKLSDMTWRAYNTFGTLNDPSGGKSLYGQGSGGISQGTRAWDVTYDAPLMVAAGFPQTSYWNGERPLHHWLEQNGYSVHYVTSYDVDRDPTRLLGHKVIISVGHDEYWTQNVRDAWDAAIASGSHAIVASGNTMLWRVRMTGRTMHCYKDSHSLDGVGAGRDPVTWTGTWRDTRWEDRRAESESIGAVFTANGIRNDSIQVPATMAAEPLWRNTTIEGLVAPGYETLTSGGLGFEWDTFEPSYTQCLRYPPAITFLSSTPINLSGNAANQDGSQYNATINPCIHRIIAYRAGDALVVNLGTNQWGWGLSDEHVRGSAVTNATVRQATVNLLADMDCQPATLETSLGVATNQLASWTFPTLTSLATPATATVAVNERVSLIAAAVWSNGITTDFAAFIDWTSSDESVATVKEGVVAGVAVGTATITATYGATTDTTTVTVTPAQPPIDTFLPRHYVHGGSAFLEGPITIGTQFRKVSTGTIYVAGVRWWRSTNTQSTAPVAYCAVVGGATLASKASSIIDAPALSGWDVITFDTPVAITSTSPHIVWVWLPSGGYSVFPNYFATAPKLSQLGLFDSTGTPGAGKFRQPPAASPDTTQPATPFNNNNYLVDPVITAQIVIPDPGEPTALSVLPATVDVGVGGVEQLVGQVSWEGISPTNETAFTTWVSGTPSIATVSTTGLVFGVAEGSATVTGTYAGFSDTCAVTVTAGAGTEYAWTGADPTAAVDAAAYELGSVFSLSTPTTLSGVRIWNPGLVTVAGRTATLWSSASPTGSSPTVRGTVDLPDLMTAGWSEHLFTTPYPAPTGVYYFVTYNVDGGGTAPTADYGTVTNGLASTITSGPIVFEINGRFGTPGSIPIGTSPAFYGVDVIYAT